MALTIYIFLLFACLIVRMPMALSDENSISSTGEDEKSDEEPPARDSLYSASDPILDISGKLQFQNDIYNKKKSFFIEFYSSWCGHCIHFAPKYRNFANDVIQWNNITQVAAVNCYAGANFDLCRDHNIPGYPSIKYFKYGSSNVNDSIFYKGYTTPESELSLGLAGLVFDDFLLNRPSDWPDMNYVNENSSIPELWLKVAAPVDYIVLVAVDNATHLTGVQTILEFSDYRSHLAVYLISLKSQAARTYSLRGSNETGGVAEIIILKRNTMTPYFVSKELLTRAEIVKKIQSHTQLNIVNKTALIVEKAITDQIEKENAIIDHSLKAKYFVHKNDLRSALWYLLYREVAKYKLIDEPKLKVLREFLEILLKYLPSDQHEKNFLFQLISWLNGITTTISEEVWRKQVDNLQKSNNYPLPTKEVYVACRGSQPKFRGYPCSLWTLFHVITVQAYKIDGSSRFFEPRKIVLSFKHYVQEIFGCVECAKNFGDETTSLAKEMQKPSDVVLYLWRVHNKVNLRLKGTKSEDPLYPKDQFPMPQLCPSCFDRASNQWNEQKTLEYLLHYYSDIKTDGVTDTRFNPKFGRRHNSPDSTSSASVFDSLDFGLCLIVWFLSTCLSLVHHVYGCG